MAQPNRYQSFWQVWHWTQIGMLISSNYFSVVWKRFNQSKSTAHNKTCQNESIFDDDDDDAFGGDN